jgi:hypothetical protein
MGERPEGTTLDRVDVNGNYEPANCRWVGQKKQIHNSRCRLTKNRSSSFKGVGWNTTNKQWRARLKVKDHTILIGHYDCEIKAAVAYNTAVLQHFGHDYHINNV